MNKNDCFNAEATMKIRFILMLTTVTTMVHTRLQGWWEKPLGLSRIVSELEALEAAL